MSWRHFVYGMQYLSRAHNRDLLARAEGNRAGQSPEDQYVAWRDQVTRGTR